MSRHWYALTAALAGAVLMMDWATAQVIESTGPDVGRRGGGPPGAPGEERSMTRTAPPGSLPPSADPRDFAGVWTVRGTSNNVLYELKPEWLGRAPAPAVSSFAVPNIGSRQCHPTAYFGQMISVYPLLIAQTDTQINFLFEENRRTRRIYIGQSLPRNPKPAYFGHSVGRWEGDTLVVETTGTRGLVDFLQQDNPALRIVERMHKVDGGKVLQIDVAYYNDRQWTKPGTFTVKYNWRPDLNLFEVVCEEFSDAFGRGYDSLR